MPIDLEGLRRPTPVHPQFGVGHGRPIESLSTKELDDSDADYEVAITMRAVNATG
ncbi:MAG TPA: hypothetical protein VNG69_04475 [Casimicrobiaceae bacterium]|nr:hypothetical protein [Casimicrobiaceae bacterium]